MNESCPIWISEYFLKSNVMNKSRPIRTSHVSYERVMSHMNQWKIFSKVKCDEEVMSHMHESRPICICGNAHRCIHLHWQTFPQVKSDGRVTSHMNESRPTWIWRERAGYTRCIHLHWQTFSTIKSQLCRDRMSCTMWILKRRRWCTSHVPYERVTSHMNVAKTQKSVL